MPHGRHLIGRAERENRHHLRQARCLVLHRVVGCGCFLLPNHAFSETGSARTAQWGKEEKQGLVAYMGVPVHSCKNYGRLIA
jgi:hypothetical protein